MAGRYDVGYGKPPKSGQFKKGKSGNPKGRTKGARGIRSILKESLGQVVAVNQGGKKKSITIQEALVKSIITSALKGDPKAQSMLIKLIVNILPLDDEPDNTLLPSAPEEHEKAIAFFEQLKAQIEAEQLTIRE